MQRGLAGIALQKTKAILNFVMLPHHCKCWKNSCSKSVETQLCGISSVAIRCLAGRTISCVCVRMFRLSKMQDSLFLFLRITMKKGTPKNLISATVYFFLTQDSLTLCDALDPGYQIPAAGMFRAAGVQWGGCVPWQRFFNYHLAKVSGKFCLKIISVEWQRILPLTFLFCGRKFRALGVHF